MDVLLLLKALLMGIVEGLTEFLPISSTGHLILVGDLLSFNDERAKVFEMVIQTGGILAIWWQYHEKIDGVVLGLFRRDKAAFKFLLNLMIAFLPLAGLGYLFGHALKAALFKPLPVAIAFIAGGLFIFWAEKRDHKVTITEVDDLTMFDALKLGIAQAFALIPGMSRSGSTIIGGLFFGLSRKAAAEFSFFLAIPTLLVAGGYDVYKHRDLLTLDDLPLFGVGIIAAYISALFAVRGLVRYISHNDFTVFAWYRIVFGLLVIGTSYSGLVQWTLE